MTLKPSAGKILRLTGRSQPGRGRRPDSGPGFLQPKGDGQAAVILLDKDFSGRSRALTVFPAVRQPGERPPEKISSLKRGVLGDFGG
jgi:hypothetical protein